MEIEEVNSSVIRQKHTVYMTILAFKVLFQIYAKVYIFP